MGRPPTYDEPTERLSIRVPQTVKALLSHGSVVAGASLTDYTVALLADGLTRAGYGDLLPDLSREPRPSATWSPEGQRRWTDEAELRELTRRWRAEKANGNGHAD
jgi:hypothetical protein